jgi:hypothetical protein
MTPWRRTLLVAVALVAIAGAVLLSLASRATPHVRDEIVTALNERLQSQVALDVFQVGVFPRPEVTGSGLAVRWEGRTDVPPLVKVGAFSASAGLFGLLGPGPLRLRQVQLDRLDLYVPPDRLRGSDSANSDSANSASADSVSESDSRTAPETAAPGGIHTRLIIDEIIARAAQLQIASKNPGKAPRVFDIHDLRIVGYGEQDGADFHARLTNPTPSGEIDTRGRFGPWHASEPRTTPVKGTYTFSNADMNTIKGLGGTLSSRGSYGGVLERIEVTGDTDIPDFSIDIAGQPVPLTTTFKAVVDGTNGDTFLAAVDARLRQSHIHAKGSVVRVEGVRGHLVTLDVTVDKARLEDLLALAVKSDQAPLTGAIQLTTTLVIPPGDVDVVRKLRLDGQFALEQANFTNFDVQKRINALSKKGQGDATAGDGPSVVSQLTGHFVLRDATLTFSRLTFAVPGAVVQLAGTYQLDSQTLDFSGQLLLDASLRETTSGAKAVLAAIAQPFFRRKGGGSLIPIRISGTRSQPSFGLDVKRALLPG